jgi:PAS domain S-box-containing protein
MNAMFLFSHLRRMSVPYLVLALMLIAAFSTFFRVRSNVEASDQVRFDRATEEVRAIFERRLTRCIDQMYGVRALFVASKSVELNEWSAYFNSMNVRQSDLGVRTLGYIEQITPETKQQFLSRWNSATKTNYTIVPPGNREVYFPAVFTTHFDWRATTIYGLDHGSRPERLEAIKQAIDQNQPVLTRRIRTIVPSGFSTNVGTFFYLPVYKNGSSLTNVEERRQALDGLVFMTIFPQKMLELSSENLENPGVSFQVYDGTEIKPEHLFFDTDAALTNKMQLHPALTRQVVLPVFNQKWTISFSTTPQFDAHSPRYLQWLALGGGLGLSFFLFGIVLMQAKARMRAEAAEAALVIEKEELAVTLFSIGDGVITADTNGNVISINKAAQKLTGWAQKDAENKPLKEVFHLIYEQNREPASNPTETVLRTGEVVELGNHILLVARDGTEHAIADSAAPIRDKTGHIMGVVLVFRDVTEKQKLEAQMAKESKLESVGLLAGGIAHDFNNMLTCITGNISLARMEGVSPEEKMHMLEAAEKAAMRAQDLTKQLLTFARGGEPIKKPMYLAGLAREACEFALRGSNVRCDFFAADNLWPVEIDEGQFRQVLNNLVINARQAMPDGGKVEVHLENFELLEEESSLPPGKYVKISVKDFGGGIPRELLSRIFEPYFTTKKSGLGLGLATAYSIVRKHDGELKVDSEVGAGSNFQIFLSASDKPIFSAPTAAPPAKFSGFGRILIMDDETPVLKTLGAMLQKFGFEVETALDGVEAIQRYTAAKAAGKPFELVIMDLTIPNGMGGREAIKQLREMDSSVKAIASSGYSLDPVMANHQEYGFCGIIPKPYRADDLSFVLQEVINQ